MILTGATNYDIIVNIREDDIMKKEFKKRIERAKKDAVYSTALEEIKAVIDKDSPILHKFFDVQEIMESAFEVLDETGGGN